ncbi:hypothetical protein PFISCL1PPCAC_4592, partial [Pristionchus fissidentatus]
FASQPRHSIAMLLPLLLLLSLVTYPVDSCMATPGTSTPAPSTACRNCAMNLIRVTTTGAGGKPMTSDNIDTSGTCAMRTMVCTGAAGQTFIEMNGGLGGTFGDTNGVVTVVLTCNAAGTEWQLMGAPVTQAECSAPP